MTREEKIKNEKVHIDAIINFLENNSFNIGSKDHVSFMQERLIQIFKLEVEEMGLTFDSNELNSEDNDIILEFINDENVANRGNCDVERIKNERGEYISKKPIITFNWHDFLQRLSSWDKNDRVDESKEMFKILFHELQHYRQFEMALSKISNKDSLTYAKDLSLLDYMEHSFYQDRSLRDTLGNYFNFALEADANLVGYSQYLDITKEDDEKIKNKRDIEIGRKANGRYSVKYYSIDKEEYYNSNGEVERDDISTILMDDAICNKHKTEFLEKYPILQKEYNMDGTKKSLSDLIQNFKDEEKQLIEMDGLDEESRKILLKDCKEMYYEIMYRKLDKESLSVVQEKYGKEAVNNLLSDMRSYFESEKNDKQQKNIRMGSARLKKEESKTVNNEGFVESEINGRKVQVRAEDFYLLLSEDKKNEKILIGEKELTLEEFVKKYKAKIPTAGKYVLKDNTIVDAKDFFENNVLQYHAFENSTSFIGFLQENTKSKVETETIVNDDRIKKYYSEKIDFIDGLKKQAELNFEEIIDGDFNAPKGILQNINPSLINQKVVLPNGNKINATQYIVEIVEPRIPESGTFKLKNGIEISARQFIEEYVMFEGQTKYKGDIDALLNDTVDSGDVPPTTDGKGVGMKQEHGYGIQNEEKQTDENSAEKETITGEELKGALKKSLVTAKEVKEQQTQLKDDKAIKEYKTLRFKKTLGSITQEEQEKMNELLNIQAVQLYDAEVNQRKQTVKKSEQNSKGMGR